MIKTMCLILSMFSNTDECKDYLELPKYQTVVSQQVLKKALSNTHIKVFGKPASQKRIDMAWAQIAFENGRGFNIYNYNLGNIGLLNNVPVKPYYVTGGSRFLSFPSLEEGAVSYWSTLKEMCSFSLGYFDIGDASGAALALKKCNYYKVDLETYSKNLKFLFFESSLNH